MQKFTTQELLTFFKSLEKEFDVLVPIKDPSGSRALGNTGDGEMELFGDALPMKPTGVFAPYQDVIMTFANGKANLPAQQKPIFVVGFTAADVACLEFIDKFYSKNFVDGPYFSRRKNSVVVCVSGRCGKGGEFLRIANGGCDIELICDGGGFVVNCYSAKGKELAATISGGVFVKDEITEDLKRESAELAQDDVALLQKASKLILENKVSDDFWKKISDRCIACTGCTLVCPTCTCFDVFDRLVCSSENIERVRLRDSCQLDGFMREASGHNPMAKEFQRTRRRIHHKLAADVVRFGHITCFNCGRCDQVCPSKIGIKSVCRELVEECKDL